MKLRIIVICLILLPMTSFSPVGGYAAGKNKDKKDTRVWPLFKGELDETFSQWVASQLTYPEYDNAEESAKRTVISFSIDEEGKLTEINELENPDPSFGAQIISILEKSPEWTPGYKKKKKLTTTYYLTVEPSLKQTRLISYRNGKLTYPTFEGGNLQTFRDWVMSQLRYPPLMQQKNIEGRVEVKFLIDRQGNIEILEYLASPDPILSTEVTRILLLSPKWTPGMIEDIPLKVYYVLPVDFILTGKPKDSSNIGR